MPSTEDIADRLEYLRGELRAERISYGELAELQGFAEHIQPGDVELLEAAGVPEHAATPELVGGPVDTFRSESDANGITLFQKDSLSDIPGRRVHLTPDDALGLLHTLLTEIGQTFAFPELIVREGKDEDDEPIAELVCPRCGLVTGAGHDYDNAVDVVDVDLRYTGGFFEGTVENPELHVGYGGSNNYEGLVTLCSNCSDPVSVPSNVTEQS